MLIQQITVNQGQGFAQLVIRADVDSIEDLTVLAEDLKERPDMITNGPIIYSPPLDPPPPV